LFSGHLRRPELSVSVATIRAMAASAVDEVQVAEDTRWLARLRATEAESRMAQARVLQIVGERDATGVAGHFRYGTVQRTMAAVLLIRTGEARNRVAAAGALALSVTPRDRLRHGIKYHANERVALQPRRFNSGYLLRHH
jgi:hypothetical protein